MSRPSITRVNFNVADFALAADDEMLTLSDEDVSVPAFNEMIGSPAITSLTAFIVGHQLLLNVASKRRSVRLILHVPQLSPGG